MNIRKLGFIVVCGLCAILLWSCDQAQGLSEKAHVRPPLSLSMRGSLVRGVVLQITNRAPEHLECRIYAVSSDGRKKSKPFRCVIKSGEMQEVGHMELDGWYLDPGEKVVISTVGYASKVLVHWDKSHIYWDYSL